MDLVAWGGLVILVGAIALGYVDNRALRRTNEYGVQQFAGYLHLTFCRVFEGTLKILGILALPSGVLLASIDMPKHMKEARAHAAAKAASSDAAASSASHSAAVPKQHPRPAAPQRDQPLEQVARSN